MEMTQATSELDAHPETSQAQPPEPVAGLDAPYSMLESRSHQMFPTLTPAEMMSYVQEFSFTLSVGNYAMDEMEVVNK